MKLLTTSNPKTTKGEKRGYHTAILHLLPSDLSGRNVCPHASPGCRKACLNEAGRGAMQSVKDSRKRKTDYFFKNRKLFMSQLTKEIEAHVRAADRKGLTPAVRLNGTSDLPFERIAATDDGRNIFQLFRDVQFYDYTKTLNRALESVQSRTWDRNYHITFSRSECNDAEVATALEAGVNVAVVFDTLPRHYGTVPVVDGDLSDLRFLDPAGVVVGLKAKGPARRDDSGFVVLS